MNPAKQKALDLIKEIYDELPCHADERKIAKNIALIMVNEMLKNDGWSGSKEEWSKFEEYCQEVKKYISYE